MCDEATSRNDVGWGISENISHSGFVGSLYNVTRDSRSKVFSVFCSAKTVAPKISIASKKRLTERAAEALGTVDVATELHNRGRKAGHG